MLLTAQHGNIQKETDTETEKSIYYDFMRFGDSSTVTNLLKQKIALIKDYHGTF